MTALPDGLVRTSLRISIGVSTVLIVFAATLELAGADAGKIMVSYFLRGWTSRTGFIESLVTATPICLCALAAAVPARFGLINIGGEGQLIAGAIGATGVAILDLSLPRVVVLSLMCLAGLVVGGLWGFLPGFLRAVTRTNETVSSLLGNYIAALVLLYLIHGRWKDPASFGWAQSAAFPRSARLPTWAGTRLHPLVPVALVLALGAAYVFRRGTIGRTARVVSSSEQTARMVGLRPVYLYTVSFLVAGAVAGLAGFGEVAAIQGRLREGISLGYGFAGFLVAWICRNRFAWIPLASFLIGGLISAGDLLQISAGLPFATVNLVQGLVLAFFVIEEGISLTHDRSRVLVSGGESDG